MSKIHRLIIGLTCILFALQGAAVFVSGAELGATGVAVSIVVTLGIGLVDLFTVRYLLATVRRIEQAYAAQVSSRLESSLENYRSETERESRLVQQIGAEINGELQAAQVALERGQLAEVDDHLQASLALASQTKPTTCDNVYVAAVLESKLRQCEEKGVALKATVSIPQELPLEDVEIASVFFNLIDNALYECVSLQQDDSEDRDYCVSVHGVVQAGQLFIEVENPCRPGIDVRRRAAKRRTDTSALHGWGTQIVSDIAGRYGGVAHFEERGGSFVAQVMLPLPQGESC